MSGNKMPRSIIAKIGDLEELARNIILIPKVQKKYKILGNPFGQSLGHCVFLGLKYCPDFEKRVKYYSINSQGLPVSVKYYEDDSPGDLFRGRFELITLYQAYKTDPSLRLAFEISVRGEDPKNIFFLRRTYP